MKYFAFVIVILSVFACTLQKEAFIFIDSQTSGRTPDGVYFLDVVIKNTGEQPGYFVILIAQAYKEGKDLQRIEKAYGDIFPNASKQQRLLFDRIGLSEPDSVSLKITYSPYQL